MQSMNWSINIQLICNYLLIILDPEKTKQTLDGSIFSDVMCLSQIVFH